MTDNDIKKALEYCSYGSEFKCQECPADDCSLSCGSKLAKQALDLINRQQAEIEKLNVDLVGMRGACESYKMHYDKAQAEIERLQKDNEYILMQHKFDRRPNGDCWNDVIEKAKTEAIKEFAERLKQEIQDVKFTIGQTWEIQCALKQTLKEMTEGNENG